MRPDYTLSIWPHGINADLAEEQELITHIHFDAKYKLKTLKRFFGSDEDSMRRKKSKGKGHLKEQICLKCIPIKMQSEGQKVHISYILEPNPLLQKQDFMRLSRTWSLCNPTTRLNQG